MLIQIYCSMISVMIANLGGCLNYICNQLNPKPLDTRVRGFLDAII